VTAALVALVILAALLARPVAVRLWLAGLISDRVLFIASVGRFPALTFLFGLILRVPLPLLLLITLLAVIPGLLFSRVIRDAIDDRVTHRR
jgi:hypothetical protein